MRKITLPKKPHKGLRIFCKVCRINTTKCKHFDSLVYRAIIKVPGSGGCVRTKMLVATNYNEAVKEIIDYRKELEYNNFETVEIKPDDGNDYNVIGAIVKYNQYLSGESDYAHLKKNISDEYRDELIRYCKAFAKNLKTTRNIERMRIKDVSKKDVSNFYSYAKTIYHPNTFNKCLNGLKGFFNYLIKIEDLKIKNPFELFVPEQLPDKNIQTLSKDEFEAVLNAIDTYDKTMTYQNDKGESIKKTMYFPWLKEGFKLCLLVGCRREEIVDLKWSDIFVAESGVKFFLLENLKVNRIKKGKKAKMKHIPINADLEQLLVELGINEKKNSSDYILFPKRDCTTKTIMDRLSRSFTHYKNGAGITKDISQKNLRKTYITWVNQVMGNQTGIITSQSNQVIDKYYLDPKVLTAIERGALEIKVFGSTTDQKEAQKGGTK